MDFHRGNWLCCTLAGLGFALGLSLPASAGEASVDVQAPALVAPGFGCGAAPTTAALFNSVALRQQPARRRVQRRSHAEARRPLPPPAEPQPSLSQAYFTCSSTPLMALPVGAGWLAVGPVRRS